MRRQWGLAMKVSRYLKLPEAEGESRILGHWACYKVSMYIHIHGSQDKCSAKYISTYIFTIDTCSVLSAWSDLQLFTSHVLYPIL